MKTTALLVKRSDHSREAFVEHYEAIHTALAVQILAGFHAYVRDHVREEIHGEVSFDVMTAFSWTDPRMLGTLARRFGTDLGAAIREDEASFMDRDASRFFLVEDHETIEAADDSEVSDAAPRINVLVKCPVDESVETYAGHFEEDELPGLCRAAGTVASCRFGTLQSADNHAALFDLVAEIELGAGGTDPQALRDRACQIEESGARVVIVAVDRHESALG
ncbi:MAG: hypothetical protein CL908_08965 [Deltaproteobacteria bacterium]|nr:hypothetical protein [Deltaproteobacteria bacterium]